MSGVVTMSDNNNGITALTQVLRYYAEPYNSKYEDKPKGERGEKNKELSAAEIQAAMQNGELEAVKNAVGPAWGAWGGPTLVFDTETQTSFGQTMRFGSYTLRGHDYQTLMKLAVEYKGAVPRDVLDQETSKGFFINNGADIITDEEKAIIQRDALERGYQYMTKEFFLKRLFYALYVSSGPRLVRSPIHGGLEPGKTLPCMIVGHNLPFDLGRLTYSYGYARDRMFGGLTYKLLKHRPDIAVKKLGFAKAMYKPHTDKNDRSNHIFVDTQQLRRALCGAPVNSSLQGLAKALKLSSPSKLEMDFDGPITIEALDYNAKDVDLTWRVYQGLRDIYEKDVYTCRDNEGRLLKPIDQILSEASRGKGLLQELGNKPPRTKFDKDEWNRTSAVAMASTYGGLAGVRHRLDIAEIIRADFKSQYTSAYLWLGLERLLTAERISVIVDEDGTGKAANWLRSVRLDMLSDPTQGPNLAGYALIETDGAILPICSEYQYFDHFLDRVEYNHQIGVNRAVSGPRCWYSFPDIVASIIKTRNCPRILKTMTFKAEGKQDGLRAKNLFGDKRYHIDPNGDEPIFKRLIDLRTVVKAEGNDGKEQGIKILASATSYGITIEFILEDRISDDPYEDGGSIPVSLHLFQPASITIVSVQENIKIHARGG
jgi:hypothetical protein